MKPTDFIPPMVRAWVYVGAVIVNAGLVLAEGLDAITAKSALAGLSALAIITAGLAIGYLPARTGQVQDVLTRDAL